MLIWTSYQTIGGVVSDFRRNDECDAKLIWTEKCGNAGARISYHVIYACTSDYVPQKRNWMYDKANPTYRIVRQGQSHVS